MYRLGLFAVSIAAIIAGSVKLAGTVFGTETLMLPTCLGTSVYVEIGNTVPVWHCWGCYALAFGLTGLIALAGTESRRILSKVRA